MADVVINYCGTSAPVYIFLFLIAIFRTVTPILNEDLLHVLHSNIGQVYVPFKWYAIHVLLHTRNTGIGIVQQAALLIVSVCYVMLGAL